MSPGTSLLVLLLGLWLASPPVPRPAPGPAGRWTACRLQVTNKTPFRVLIHVDGVYWGWVNAHQVFVFKGIPQGTIAVHAATQYGEFFWGPHGLKCEGTAAWELAF